MSNKRGRDLNRLMPIQDHGAGTFKFWDSDSEDRFKENLKCQPEDWIYRTIRFIFTALPKNQKFLLSTLN